MKYFDAHCHIQFDQYAQDREQILAAMAEKGVGGLIVGTDAASSRAACELVQNHENLYASVGQHPNHDMDEVFDEHLYRNLMMYPKTVAVGECGLDYYRPSEVNDELKKAQKELFLKHIHLAGKTKRPLMIHARPSKGTMDAYEDAIDMLTSAKKEYGDLGIHMHFFVGDVAIAKKLFELDATVSYTAVLTFTHDYDNVVRFAPLDRLITETDSPYVAPVSRRGQRNDPLSVIEVVGKIAEIRGEDEEGVRAALMDNAIRRFGLSTTG